MIEAYLGTSGRGGEWRVSLSKWRKSGGSHRLTLDDRNTCNGSKDGETAALPHASRRSFHAICCILALSVDHHRRCT
ncbi:MAG: hypothetical protein VX115_07685, partial [Candidatus Thermoplasmatota archaeon]|nr:hypothetical protein [Candidatus Thermoplasmatota archaeon]